MNKSPSLDTKELLNLINATAHQIRRYMVVFYVLLLAGVYGFVLYRVNQLMGVQPSDADVSSKIQASATPHVDAATVKQMQNLQDNSVNVQSLFDQARNNPFQE